MENEQNGQGDTQMARMEKLMDLLIADHVAFSEEHKKLLTAQVVLTDRVDKLAISIEADRKANKEAIEAERNARREDMKDLDQRLTVLIQIMDDLIRREGGRP